MLNAQNCIESPITGTSPFSSHSGVSSPSFTISGYKFRVFALARSIKLPVITGVAHNRFKADDKPITGGVWANKTDCKTNKEAK